MHVKTEGGERSLCGGGWRLFLCDPFSVSQATKLSNVAPNVRLCVFSAAVGGVSRRTYSVSKSKCRTIAPENIRLTV